MAEVIYINTEEDEKGSHNKFWSYEITGATVVYRWGRVGRTPQSKSKPYNDRDLQKLIQEKINKGYQPSTAQKLKDEVTTAQEMGTQYKIKKLQWVRRLPNSLTLEKLDKYDPKYHVLVEVIDSWKKNVTRLLLSKDDTLEIVGGVTEVGSIIGINKVNPPTGQGFAFAQAVRNVLKRLSAAVTAIVQKVSFAALGRNLFDDDDAEAELATVSATPSYLDEIAKLDAGGVDSSVLSTFASMGRALEF